MRNSRRKYKPTISSYSIRNNLTPEINRFNPDGTRAFIGEIWDRTTQEDANRFVYHMADKGTITVYANNKSDAVYKIKDELK